MDVVIKPGRIVFLDELEELGAEALGGSFRVMGRIVKVDNSEGARVEIVHGGASLVVGMQHVGGGGVPLVFKEGSLFQFIGEIDPDPFDGMKFILQARVARNVDGLDENLFRKAIELRRKFEADSLSS
eukprot:TRINITY_DN8271_c0_g1_i1.p3 TRINITY_DN8271_c0_g1~~TRINITY_DN8271_c0_g1_i1.p3  ORF type:complete len:128 (-),score=34.07 TRINITY_DN8271_c0_g1_i1:353-736(-)